MSDCCAVVTDSQLLQTNTIDSFPRFFHGGYCRPQSIHWAPDDQFHVDCKDSDNLIKVKAPWDWLCLEVLGPLPVTRNGHRYIVTVTDLYSKWVEALPIRACVSAQVTRHIVDLVKHFGYPLGMLSRLPQDLVQQINMALREPLSISSSLLIFHQQTSSVDFTTQRAVDRMVSELVQHHAADWDVYLPAQVFGLCLQEHSRTKKRPFSLLFAKEVEPIRTPRTLNSEDLVDIFKWTRLPQYTALQPSLLPPVAPYVAPALCMNTSRHGATLCYHRGGYRFDIGKWFKRPVYFHPQPSTGGTYECTSKIQKSAFVVN